ncbi:hypothetical protein BFP70_01700 [Thioclava sp. SK-1]|uniref:DUF1850 domain-containing protein n=1 Tax=Thioclava sp. SK-1 TaxID=1889770 RepID=UPI000824B4F8|nr:DUF1850 domain-containing protein [Thioclava sp. SK-1]OCX67332.1 hypothetical protein BFP70_01700 [Thioclava sp. SK-1]
MSSCLMAGAIMLALAPGDQFSLSWTHSVERQAWSETWALRDGQLQLIRAAVKGSGAGMEPGEGGRFLDGWWVWAPDLPPVSALHLAASGLTPSAWQLCGASCIDLGAAPAEVIDVTPCPPQP